MAPGTCVGRIHRIKDAQTALQKCSRPVSFATLTITMGRAWLACSHCTEQLDLPRPRYPHVRPFYTWNSEHTQKKQGAAAHFSYWMHHASMTFGLICTVEECRDHLASSFENWPRAVVDMFFRKLSQISH